MTIRTKCNKLEPRKTLNRLKELRAAGMDLEIPADLEEQFRTLDVRILTGGSNEVFDGMAGQMLYAVSVRLEARRLPLVVVDCFCQTDWEYLIPACLSIRKQSTFRWGRETFPVQRLLNDYLETQLRFTYYGQVVEGSILFFGFEPVPDRYRGACAPFFLTLEDESGEQFEVESKLFVHRETQPKLQRSMFVPSPVQPERTATETVSEQIDDSVLRTDSASSLRASGKIDPVDHSVADLDHATQSGKSLLLDSSSARSSGS